MVMRSRLPRKPPNLDKERLKVVGMDGKKLWTFKWGEGKASIGYLGRVPKWQELMLSEPPYYRVILPPSMGRFVRINWKTGILSDLVDNKPIGRLPEKLKWEKYVPVNILKKGHPLTITERELEETKEQARKIKREAQPRKILKEAGIEILPKVPLRERLKPSYILEKMKKEIP